MKSTIRIVGTAQSMDELTADEIASLPWNPGEKYALVNRENKSMEYASDSKEWLEGTLQRMTPKHPVYAKLQLVERP